MTAAPAFPSVLAIAAVGIGAAAGAWLRWALAWRLNPLHPWLPLGTLTANVAGGLMVGIAVAVFARHPELDPAWRLAIVTGFLGGLTTFSSFSAESLALLHQGRFGLALLHCALHVGCALAAAAIGHRLASLA